MKHQMFLALSSFGLLLTFICGSEAYDNAFNLELGKRYVALCGVAYCTDPFLTKNSVNDWSCKACKQFPGTVATSFHADNRTDATGFVAYDPNANEIIVSFSGTDPLSIQNWIDDLDFIKTSYPFCSGCEVHEGFYRAYNSVADKVKSLLKSYQTSYPSASLAVTGHSLGAAEAAHCAADLTHAGYKLKTMYAYGMPRVGNEAFEKWYMSTVPGTFRVVHMKDPVPHLPPNNWGFHHMAYEVFYELDYSKWKLCNSEGEDSSCSDKYLVDLDVLNHLNYLDFDFTTNYLSCEV